MEEIKKQIEVAVSKTKDGIKVKNSFGLDWTFPDTLTAHDALVLLLSRTIRMQFEKQAAFRNTFTIEMTIK